MLTTFLHCGHSFMSLLTHSTYILSGFPFLFAFPALPVLPQVFVVTHLVHSHTHFSFTLKERYTGGLHTTGYFMYCRLFECVSLDCATRRNSVMGSKICCICMWFVLACSEKQYIYNFACIDIISWCQVGGYSWCYPGDGSQRWMAWEIKKKEWMDVVVKSKSVSQSSLYINKSKVAVDSLVRHNISVYFKLDALKPSCGQNCWQYWKS